MDGCHLLIEEMLSYENDIGVVEPRVQDIRKGMVREFVEKTRIFCDMEKGMDPSLCIRYGEAKIVWEMH